MKKFFKALSITGATALTAAPAVSCNIFSPLKYTDVGSDAAVIALVTPGMIDPLIKKKTNFATGQPLKDLNIKGDPLWFAASQILLSALFKQTCGKQPLELDFKNKDSLIESLKKSSIESYYFAATAKKDAPSFKISCYKIKASLGKDNKVKIKTSEKHARIIKLK